MFHLVEYPIFEEQAERKQVKPLQVTSRITVEESKTYLIFTFAEPMGGKRNMVIYNDSLKSWLISKRREPKKSVERMELLCSYPSARDSETSWMRMKRFSRNLLDKLLSTEGSREARQAAA